MTTHSRRTFVAIAGLSGLGLGTLTAREDKSHGDHGNMATCGTDMATPAVVPFESDIPFDLAYIDSMIPHHASVVALSELALEELEDERLLEIAQAVLDTQPGEMEMLTAFRKEWYPDEPEDISDDRLMEMMMVTMAMDPSCSHDDGHMQLMDSEWLVAEFENAEDKDLAYIDLVIPHHEMAVRQSVVGLQLAEHEELRALLDDVIEAQTAEIELLTELREELGGAHH